MVIDLVFYLFFKLLYIEIFNLTSALKVNMPLRILNLQKKRIRVVVLLRTDWKNNKMGTKSHSPCSVLQVSQLLLRLYLSAKLCSLAMITACCNFQRTRIFYCFNAIVKWHIFFVILYSKISIARSHLHTIHVTISLHMYVDIITKFSYKIDCNLRLQPYSTK